MTPDKLTLLKSDDETRKRMAKWMAHLCFRNSKLEDMRDRISDDEMKTLMIDVVNRSYFFLSILFKTKGSNEIIELLKQGEHLPPEWRDWKDPEISDELTKSANRLHKMLFKGRASELG
jgi:hypothetical protein